MNTEIKNMTVTELKALAYDQISLLEQTQNNLRVINAEIQSKLIKPVQPITEVKGE